MLAFCLLAALASAKIVLNTLPPQYTASAEVILNNRATTIVNVPDVVGAPVGHNLAASELRILTSQHLLQQVVDRLRLDRDPEFNRNLAPEGGRIWKAQLREFAEPVMRLAGISVSTGHSDINREEDSAVVEKFREAVRISAVPQTRSLTVSITLTDPEKAALIANTLADLYIVDQLESKFDTTRRASAWLNRRLEELKESVQRSEAAVIAYRANQSLGPGQGRELTAQQIAELNSELIIARAAQAEAEARANQVESRIKRGGIGAAANVLSSELILTLRTAMAGLIRREAELAARYGPKHPKMIDVRAEIADSRGAIAREVGKIVEGLKNDAAVARARTSALEKSLNQLQETSVALNRTTVHLNQLEREATADREIYENFLNRVREIKERETLQSADARILSIAIPPNSASGPNRRKIILLAIAFGLFVGLSLIVLIEATAHTIRAAPELTEPFGLPVLAILPKMQGLSGRRLLQRLERTRGGLLADSGRALNAATRLCLGGTAPQIVAVTSSTPDEDSALAALMLAHAASRSGKRTLLIDADVAAPRYSALLPRGATGLLAFLNGAENPVDAIIQPEPGGPAILPAPRPRPSAGDLITPENMTRLLNRVREEFDLIVIDAPPVLTGIFAAVTARNADALLFAVRWKHTPRSAVAEALNRLGDTGLRPTGFLLTKTDKRQEARNAFARYGTGYGELARRRT